MNFSPCKRLKQLRTNSFSKIIMQISVKEKQCADAETEERTMCPAVYLTQGLVGGTSKFGQLGVVAMQKLSTDFNLCAANEVIHLLHTTTHIILCLQYQNLVLGHTVPVDQLRATHQTTQTSTHDDHIVHRCIAVLRHVRYVRSNDDLRGSKLTNLHACQKLLSVGGVLVTLEQIPRIANIVPGDTQQAILSTGMVGQKLSDVVDAVAVGHPIAGVLIAM
mmetsp:Transcript_47483/g.82968  ORF Transcript_47483/g.82968 Transcript_47483/m.82968 type:complete len:220 (+) Transcript_47483:1603-2262(+)